MNTKCSKTHYAVTGETLAVLEDAVKWAIYRLYNATEFKYQEGMNRAAMNLGSAMDKLKRQVPFCSCGRPIGACKHTKGVK